MTLRRQRRASLAVPWTTIRGATGADGEIVRFRFDDQILHGLAVLTPLAASRVRGPYPRPVTDLLDLELMLGAGLDPDLLGDPAELTVAVEPFHTSSVAIARASQWAAFCTRVAVIPPKALKPRDALEAQYRGIWVIDTDGHVLVTGDIGPWPGSSSGIMHRQLAEALWEHVLVTSADGRRGQGRSTSAVRAELA